MLIYYEDHSYLHKLFQDIIYPHDIFLSKAHDTQGVKIEPISYGY